MRPIPLMSSILDRGRIRKDTGGKNDEKSIEITTIIY